MELYPAIDLRGGSAVRLTQGDFGRETQYGDPLSLAANYVAGGASWIHVVDLDAARTGSAHERATLATIVQLASAAGSVSVQAGGGLRTEDDVRAVLDLGVARAVMGTAALEDPSLASKCATTWPGQIAVGLDYVVRADGETEALGHGWLAGGGRSPAELLELWQGDPIGAVVATSIARDGMLGGPDLAGLAALLEETQFDVIASGGVGSLDDLAALAALTANGRRLSGVIVGKALVERRFSVREALSTCAASA
ncbi:MAG TPA: 1-(5-phosphoribosyl)-5-[(5-phosphoribosylamino)methylideneamino] imidazole-4-carboxamide isomerase [Acidimicrobiales bacterium]|jgi:phosphoribosylformimino-5-aminoimidazole carboxamide ribotide isomerase